MELTSQPKYLLKMNNEDFDVKTQAYVYLSLIPSFGEVNVLSRYLINMNEKIKRQVVLL